MSYQFVDFAEFLRPGGPIARMASRLHEMGLGVGRLNRPVWDMAALEKSSATFASMNFHLKAERAEEDGAKPPLPSVR